MSQRKNQIYNFINNPLIYKIIQHVMSGTSFRNSIIKKNIRKSNLKILDIGCGNSSFLSLFNSKNKTGYDIDKNIIIKNKLIALNIRSTMMINVVVSIIVLFYILYIDVLIHQHTI